MVRFLALLLLAAPAVAKDGALQIAPIGDVKLESGATLRDCRIGYRTFGTLNADRSNAILFPTWFSGRSIDLAGMIGPGRLADSSRYFVIAVDALGDGVSSSPSNSKAQPRMQFPKITIVDMVNAEHQFVTQTLKLTHLYAVMGISMGGMQTFQWIVSYPDFMTRAVPIVGSPQLTSYDMLLWRTEENAIETDQAWNHGDYQKVPAAAMRLVQDIHTLNLTTPAYRVAHTAPTDFPSFASTSEKPPSFDANDWLRQLQAMLTMDVSKGLGTLDAAAARVHAKTLVIVGVQDHMVNPQPAIRFARALKANTVEIDSDCGHLVTGCEAQRIVAEVSRFLQ